MDAKRTPEIERHQAKLAKDPTSRAFAQLADAYRKEGLLDEAISICLKGLEQHPNYPSAHVVLGRAYLEKGALQEAEAEFLKVIELTPGDNVVTIVPWYHIYGLTATLLAPLWVGGTVTYTDDYRNLVAFARRVGVTVMVGVPKLYHALWRRILENVEGDTLRRLL
ncbi:MAG: tetratricopeptide repeat protein, partial [Candidatus Methylomirabilales bacterium]